MVRWPLLFISMYWYLSVYIWIPLIYWTSLILFCVVRFQSWRSKWSLSYNVHLISYQWTHAVPETMLYLTILCIVYAMIQPILTSQSKQCSEPTMNCLKWYFIVLVSLKACSLWGGQLFWASPQTLKKKEQWKRILECKTRHTTRLDSVALILIKFKIWIELWFLCAFKNQRKLLRIMTLLNKVMLRLK